MAAVATTTNVVRLPTAVSRKVKQPTPRRRRIAMDAGISNVVQIPIEFLYPWQHEEVRKEEILKSLNRTPELLIAMSLLAMVDRDTQRRTIACINEAAIGESDEASEQALIIAGMFRKN